MADDPDDPKVDDDKKTDDTDDLGDGGKKALDQERKARRDAEKKAKDLEGRLKAIEDKDKSELERLSDENATLKKDLDAATVQGARLKVALEKGLTLTQAKRLVGDNEDDLSADADELLADLGAKPGEERKAPPSGGRPREDLKPGGGEDPDTPVETTDVRAIGERMFAS